MKPFLLFLFNKKIKSVSGSSFKIMNGISLSTTWLLLYEMIFLKLLIITSHRMDHVFDYIVFVKPKQLIKRTIAYESRDTLTRTFHPTTNLSLTFNTSVLFNSIVTIFFISYRKKYEPFFVLKNSNIFGLSIKIVKTGDIVKVSFIALTFLLFDELFSAKKKIIKLKEI